MDEIKRILVLSRSTKTCKRAVERGLSLAEKYGAELFILHVIHNPFGLEGWSLPVISVTDLENGYQNMQAEAKADIDAMVSAQKSQGLAVQTILGEGEPNQELFKTISEKNIDLVIFVSHSQWRLERLLFGQSNDEIIRKMPCSLMMIKDEPHAVKS